VPKKIVAIGITLPHDEVRFESIHSKVSLLDYDISIFDPDIISFYRSGSSNYMGKPALDDTNSFKLKDQISHWEREISGAVKAGKTVFLLLDELQDV
jgi:hypothetical protein